MVGEHDGTQSERGCGQLHHGLPTVRSKLVPVRSQHRRRTVHDGAKLRLGLPERRILDRRSTTRTECSTAGRTSHRRTGIWWSSYRSSPRTGPHCDHRRSGCDRWLRVEHGTKHARGRCVAGRCDRRRAKRRGWRHGWSNSASGGCVSDVPFRFPAARGNAVTARRADARFRAALLFARKRPRSRVAFWP